MKKTRLRKILAWLLRVGRPPLIARIRVRVSYHRGHPGTLEAFTAAGALLSGPWPAMTKADPARQGAEDTPLGQYSIGEWGGADARLSPERHGTVGFLQLKPVQARADPFQPMIHGGAHFLTPTDGGIRVPDEAIQEMLLFLPAGSQFGTSLLADVSLARDHGWWWEARVGIGSPARRAWIAALRRRTSETGADDGEEDVDVSVDGSDGVESSFTDEDRAAAAELREAGYEQPACNVDIDPYGPSGGSYDR